MLNHTTKRFPRTSQADPWRGVITHYRAPLLLRWWRPLANVLFVLLMFGGLAGMLAWGGRAWP